MKILCDNCKVEVEPTGIIYFGITKYNEHKCPKCNVSQYTIYKDNLTNL